MLRLAAIVLAGLVLAPLPAAAEPSDGFDTMGMPGHERFRRQAPAFSTAQPRSVTRQQAAAARVRSAAPAAVAARNDDDDDDSRPQRRAAPIVAPKFLDGGARPTITAAAPPTIDFPNSYGTGTVIIDTAGRQLLYVLSATQAFRYPISVGREGFQWTGTETISRVATWPDWRPPAEMRQRNPRLPELMSGGLNNPLGARALYLGSTLYRIHGTNDTRSIGYAASSGCFRMNNAHVMHLSQYAGVGTRVVVLKGLPRNVAGSGATKPAG